MDYSVLYEIEDEPPPLKLKGIKPARGRWVRCRVYTAEYTSTYGRPLLVVGAVPRGACGMNVLSAYDWKYLGTAQINLEDFIWYERAFSEGNLSSFPAASR